jgi:hypothetical protein
LRNEPITRYPPLNTLTGDPGDAGQSDRARLLRRRTKSRALLSEAGSVPARGKTIIDHTPTGRFGEPDNLIWLCGPGASFVNDIVVPVDGGSGAFSGV